MKHVLVKVSTGPSSRVGVCHQTLKLVIIRMNVHAVQPWEEHLHKKYVFQLLCCAKSRFKLEVYALLTSSATRLSAVMKANAQMRLTLWKIKKTKSKLGEEWQVVKYGLFSLLNIAEHIRPTIARYLDIVQIHPGLTAPITPSQSLMRTAPEAMQAPTIPTTTPFYTSIYITVHLMSPLVGRLPQLQFPSELLSLSSLSWSCISVAEDSRRLFDN